MMFSEELRSRTYQGQEGGGKNVGQLKTVAVFCGSQMGLRPEYQDATTEFGRLLGDRRIRVVYGGARVGLMGVLADAVLERSGHVIGVIPQTLEKSELAHSSLSELVVVDSMHQRNAMMMSLRMVSSHYRVASGH